MLLTHLCTYNNHLIQGAPTSSYISNLVMKDFDEEIGEWCELKSISYTRYSDDMTFSGDFNPSEIIKLVRKLLLKVGLELNDEKIHVVSNSQSQSVTGIVVNVKTQTSRKYRDKLRQEIYYINKYGIDSHLQRIGIKDSKKYLNSLYGKVLYILQINETDNEFLKYKDILNKLIKSR